MRYPCYHLSEAYVQLIMFFAELFKNSCQKFTKRLTTQRKHEMDNLISKVSSIVQTFLRCFVAMETASPDANNKFLNTSLETMINYRQASDCQRSSIASPLHCWQLASLCSVLFLNVYNSLCRVDKPKKILKIPLQGTISSYTITSCRFYPLSVEGLCWTKEIYCLPIKHLLFY